MLGQQLQLLAAATEEEGVTSLEAHHVFTLHGLVQQDLIDLVLGHRVAGGLLAHVDVLGLLRHHGQNGGADQPVIHHHLRLLEGLQPLPGQQAGVAGACPHQCHFTRHGCPSFMELASCSASPIPCSLGPETLSRNTCPASFT